MRLLRICLTAVFVFAVGAVALAQEKKKEVQTLEAKTEKPQRAKFVDFGSELGLPLASLDSLGERIDEARLNSNPVELTMAAKLLAAAESITGKKASVTSKGLQQEAIELAKIRSNPAELSTLAKLVGGDAGEDLAALAEATQDEKKTEPGEATKDLDGYLTVLNHGHSEVHVYVNGYEIGHVFPHSSRTFHVHHVHHVTARDHFGHRWHRHFDWGHYHHARLVIYPPHHHHFHP